VLAAGSELSDSDVRTAIRNSGGVKGSLLIPEAPFELLVRRAIGRLLAPALQCKDLVHAELLRIAKQSVPRDVGRFPSLQVRGHASSRGANQWGRAPRRAPCDSGERRVLFRRQESLAGRRRGAAVCERPIGFGQATSTRCRGSGER
jgi:Dynamin central region